MSVQISFLGGAGTVTGSKFLLQHEDQRLLVDCGLFQGYKQLRLRNWMPPPVAPGQIDAVVLTHAHLDHSGYLPLLVREHTAGGVIHLAVPLIADIAPGQTGTIVAGCLKRFEDCRDKFANVLNFGGHKDIPSTEELVGQ